jgi:hypothetical protein
MTSIINQNISSLYSTQANDYDYDYDYELERSYGYCDAMGNPYVDTIIQSRLNDIYTKYQTYEPIIKLADDDRNMLTDLSDPSDKCPMRFMSNDVSWGSAVSAYNDELADIKETEALADFTEFNKQSDDDVLREERQLKLASLPKFPKAMLERMKKAAIEMARKRPTADKKFYTWKKGVTSSNTSHTAWGHRRSGGGKGKTLTLSEMNSEKAIAEQAAKKRIRQQVNKEKAEVESHRIAEKMKKLGIQKIEFMGEKTPEPTESVVEETAFQMHRRMEMAHFNTISAPEIDYVIEKPKFNTESKGVKFTVIDRLKSSNDKIASTIMKSFYTKDTRGAAIKRLSVMKSKGGESKTRLCKSVILGGSGKCPHGNTCKFAHSISQLKITSCVFGDKCNFVKKEGESWENTKLRICHFGHPGEDQEALCKRTGTVVKKEAPSTGELSVIRPITKSVNAPEVKRPSTIRENISYSSALIKPEDRPITKSVNAPEVKRPSTIRENISYSSVVEQQPRVFKIHKDQLHRTAGYITSIGLTNFIIEFIEPRVFTIHKDQITRTVGYITSMRLTNVIIEFI